MIRRSLVLALAAALFPLAANATDLLQVYEMARNSDPQLASAESNRLYEKEGAVQARAALLPQINGTASLQRSHSETQRGSGELDNTGKSRSYAIQGQQTLVNFAQFSTLRAQKARSLAA